MLAEETLRDSAVLLDDDSEKPRSVSVYAVRETPEDIENDRRDAELIAANPDVGYESLSKASASIITDVAQVAMYLPGRAVSWNSSPSVMT